jgi:hypothetical protein
LRVFRAIWPLAAALERVEQFGLVIGKEFLCVENVGERAALVVNPRFGCGRTPTR